MVHISGQVLPGPFADQRHGLEALGNQPLGQLLFRPVIGFTQRSQNGQRQRMTAGETVQGFRGFYRLPFQRQSGGQAEQAFGRVPVQRLQGQNAEARQLRTPVCDEQVAAPAEQLGKIDGVPRLVQHQKGRSVFHFHTYGFPKSVVLFFVDFREGGAEALRQAAFHLYERHVPVGRDQGKGLTYQLGLSAAAHAGNQQPVIPLQAVGDRFRCNGKGDVFFPWHRGACAQCLRRGQDLPAGRRGAAHFLPGLIGIRFEALAGKDGVVHLSAVKGKQDQPGHPVGAQEYQAVISVIRRQAAQGGQKLFDLWRDEKILLKTDVLKGAEGIHQRFNLIDQPAQQTGQVARHGRDDGCALQLFPKEFGQGGRRGAVHQVGLNPRPRPLLRKKAAHSFRADRPAQGDAVELNQPPLLISRQKINLPHQPAREDAVNVFRSQDHLHGKTASLSMDMSII